MPAKITVVVPIYQGERYLRECLLSLQAQTLTEMNVILGDNGSSDRSIEIAREFLRDSRFSFHIVKQRGLFQNLNFLLSLPLAPIVRILCQDDALEPTCLEQEVRFFQRYPLIGLSFSKALRTGESSEILSSPETWDLPTILSPDLAAQHFFYHGCIAGNLSTVSFRRELLKTHGVFDTSYQVSADYDLWSRYCRNNYLGILQQALVRVRSHERQLSRAESSLPLFVAENRKIRAGLRDMLPAKVQRKARWYEQVRHGVLDLHSAGHLLLRGKTRLAWRILQMFSLRELSVSFAAWLVTGNNRFYRPQAPWVLTCDLNQAPQNASASMRRPATRSIAS